MGGFGLRKESLIKVLGSLHNSNILVYNLPDYAVSDFDIIKVIVDNLTNDQFFRFIDSDEAEQYLEYNRKNTPIEARKKNFIIII